MYPRRGRKKNCTPFARSTRGVRQEEEERDGKKGVSSSYSPGKAQRPQNDTSIGAKIKGLSTAKATAKEGKKRVQTTLGRRQVQQSVSRLSARKPMKVKPASHGPQGFPSGSLGRTRTSSSGRRTKKSPSAKKEVNMEFSCQDENSYVFYCGLPAEAKL